MGFFAIVNKFGMQVECKGDRNNSLSKAFETPVQVLRKYMSYFRFSLGLLRYVWV